MKVSEHSGLFFYWLWAKCQPLSIQLLKVRTRLGHDACLPSATRPALLIANER